MPGSCCDSCRSGNVYLRNAYRAKDPVQKGSHTRTYSNFPKTMINNRFNHHTNWHNKPVSQLEYKTHGSYSGRNKRC